MSARLVALSALLLAFGPGCYPEIRIDDPDGSPPPWDAGFVAPTGKCVEAAGVDLLLVVDNSNSMSEEQASLAEQLPTLVERLVDPPDMDRDGSPDWAAVTDLQVGVVTTDMGTGGFTVPTCATSDFGDDGVLLERSSAPGCPATAPPFLRFTPAGSDPRAFAEQVGCVARAGTGGCGFEQPLEAALKAVAPSAPTSSTPPGYAPPVFFRGTSGHADGRNAGFVREDTLLAVLVITDEEDCSARDPEIFNPSSSRFGATDLNLRCFVHADEALTPVARYVEGLTALRASRPDLVAFGVIGGVPTDLATGADATDATYQRILDDPRMEERIDPAMATRLVPSCDVPGRGVAFPPRRLVQVARALGPQRSTVQSICQDDFSPAAEALARLFGSRACRDFED